MRCRICHAGLTVRGHRKRGAREVQLYNPCPRLDDSMFHPAARDRQGPWNKGQLQFSHLPKFGSTKDRIEHAKARAKRLAAKFAEEIAAGRTKGAEKVRPHMEYWTRIAEGKA